MSEKLGDYRRKRDFGATPEPAGGGGRDGAADLPRFVVQEHHARRLHWDLRLERDGVLKSWAVPKGIPGDPDRNHLAVHTEDHPLEYLDFSGEIPAGEYGAGRMTIWDRGTYEEHKFRDDEVMVTFHGERVRGRYVLFRTRGDDWLMHRMDPPQDPGREPLPRDLRPMLARLGGLPAGDGRWAYELKWDGVRALCFSEPGELRLEARSGTDITARYPEVHALGRELGARTAVLDGEIVALDAEGRPSFERLQRRMHLASDAVVRRRRTEVPVTYVIFDLLFLDGRPLLDRPYSERRELLLGLGLEGPAWRTPEHQVGHGRELLELTRERGLEGIVAKRLDSRYEPGRRSAAWLKVKNVWSQELVIGGYMPGEGGRSGAIGSLLVGFWDASPAEAERRGEPQRLVYAGKVGTGFTEDTLRDLARALEPLERAGSPFSGRRPPRGAVFCEPELVAQVEFREWTRTRTLRAPSFKGLRADRDPREVVFEAPAGAEEVEADVREAEAGAGDGPAREPSPGGGDGPAEALAALGAGGELPVAGRALKVSNLGKVLYPAAGTTKRDVLGFYARIAPVLLPHLEGRPLTLKRYPDGVDAEFFYEKQCPRHRPDWVRTAAVDSERSGRRIDFCLADDLPTLLWVANLASIELHTSLSRAEDAERPTMLVFDLDPGAPAGILECARVALDVRAMFGQLGLESFAKTSGSKGLQVYVPLNTPVTYDETKPFAHAVARLLEQRSPGTVVSRMRKDLRKGKVLVDWSQNDRSKTTVCVYSLRARERPTVSTPVAWDEVERAHAAGDAGALAFEAGEVLRRVEERGDLFGPVLELRQQLPEL